MTQAMTRGGAPDPALTEVFRQIRADARADQPTPDGPDMATLLMEFDGGTTPLTPNAGGVLEVPFDCRIMGARIFVRSGDPVSSATIDVRGGTYLDYPQSTPIYDTIPTLSAAQKADIVVTNWPIRHLLRRDIVTYSLPTISGGATYIALALWVRKLTKPVASTGITDSSGNPITTTAGDAVQIRR